jgi:excinuclease UvrABC nuclease subunit
METEAITIPPIVLRWSAWHSWQAIAADARSAGGVAIPHEPGVYEARYADVNTGVYLHIGKASSLRFRVKQGLVKGGGPHSAGQSIRAAEDVSRIVVRWAVTDRPGAVEEELHRRYRERFGSLPKHTKHT